MRHKAIKLLFSLVALLTIVGGCSPSEKSKESEQSEEVVVEQPVESSVESEESLEIVESEEPMYLSIETMRQLLEESFDGLFEVEYDTVNHSFNLMAREKQLVDEITLTMSGLMSFDAWNEMAEGMRQMSLTVSEATGEETLMIIVLNPFDRGKSLLTVVNGAVLYNVADEMGGN